VPFHRFDRLARSVSNPLLAKDSQGATLDGRFMYFRHLHQAAGTGSELHYHPNELIIFPLVGRMNVVVGKDHRIVGPGTFVHIPPYARHSTKATQDGRMEYLYIKDRTWSLLGFSAKDGTPGQAAAAKLKTARAKSPMIVNGLGNCFYTVLDRLDAPAASASRSVWHEGTRLGFGLIELIPCAGEKSSSSPHEVFLYVLHGRVRAAVAGRRKLLKPGDVIEIPRGARYELAAAGGQAARLAGTRSTTRLESQLPRSKRAPR
jgi:quercetin dioxygenase-like cupin family protein